MEWLTIFTPTYNRAHLLGRLYEKLCIQEEKNFVWLIIDDGSSDNTKEVVKEIQSKSLFKIEYVFQENTGKQRAVNTALEHCKTRWFAFCDSDDWYLEKTTMRMKELCESIEDNIRVGGVVARRGDINLSCLQFPRIVDREMIINLPVLYEKYGFHAETCAVFKTEALKTAAYPVIDDKFIPESYMFDKYSQNYDVLFCNEIWSVTEYLADGLTVQSTSLYHKNPEGVYYALREATNTEYGIKKNIKNQISLSLWKKVHHIQKHDRCPLCYLIPVSIGYLLCIVLKKPAWIWENK